MDEFMQLQPHPASEPRAVTGVQVALERVAPGKLWVRYMISGPLDELALPDPAEPERADELWKTTCLELFLRADNTDSYLEYNFSPSSQWAAYKFHSYREGRTDLPVAVPPRIDLSAASDLFDAEVVVELNRVERATLSVTVIVEESDGHKSYWALAHPPEGPPDFHHPACFVLELPPATAP